MTPLMGIGLAIVQGNEVLARMTLRTSALGFVLAFVLAFGIGSLDSEFGIATEEMRARHWPSLVDLAVAFVSGLAGAYASGRPGLLAALPGVAIAASLVPPIAASGLALSIGNYDLAIGAVLLFAVNMVAIVLATALVLWVVGLRSGHRLSLWSRLATTGVVLLAVAMAVGLAVSPPRSAPPLALVNAVEAALDEEARLRRIRLIHEDGPVIQIDLGVSAHALQKPRDDLLAVVRKYVSDRPTVRVTYRVEDDLK
jgi:uncharacterized hydrophobic protein (TIGR00271 family)